MAEPRRGFHALEKKIHEIEEHDREEEERKAADEKQADRKEPPEEKRGR